MDLIIENTNDFIIHKAYEQDLITKKLTQSEENTFFNQRVSNFWKLQDFKQNPFQSFCFSIKTNSNYKIRIHSVSNLFYTFIIICIYFKLTLFCINIVNTNLLIIIVG